MSVSAVKSEAAPAEAAPPAGGKKSIIKLALIALLVIGIGGGAYWYFAHKGGDAVKEVKHEPPKPPVFLPLEAFTVNLVLVDNPQFLQTAITLKVSENSVVDELKLRLPVVRDRILMLMSSRKAAELLTVDGKRQLGDDIVASMNQILGASAGKTKADAHAGDGKAADAEEEKDAEEPADAQDAKAAKGAGGGKAEAKSGDAADQPVQAVLFTTFIIQ